MSRNYPTDRRRYLIIAITVSVVVAIVVATNLANHSRELYIAQSKRIRDKWQPWALAHKEMILKLRHAPSSDLDVVVATYKGLPNGPKDAGFPMSYLVVQGKPKRMYQRPDGGELFTHPDFTWNASNLDKQYFTLANADTRLASGQPKHFFEDRLKRDFVKNHDIALCSSSSPSSSQITLWISGRITEVTHHLQKPTKDNPLGDAEPIEIVPPYDFLR